MINPMQKRSKGALLGVGLALALGGFGLLQAGAGTASKPSATLKIAESTEATPRNSFAPVVKKVVPAVVNISVSKVVKAPTSMGGPGMNPFFRQFFGDGAEGFQPPKGHREQGAGSGVIVSPEGYVLTNNHVIDGASEVKVILSDKREFAGKIIGADPKTDIAVLKLEGENFPYVTISDSSKVQVGDFALAIGNPFGVGQTVTMGIVSAVGRGGLGIEDYEDFIQTDAPINPGNSGGALVNERGELIGINTAILAGGGGGNQGIGFAVPVNLARQVMDQIMTHGKVTRAYLGIVPQDVTPAIAKAFNVKDLHGALVGDVSPNSPAQKAGLEKGDIIVAINGKPVENANQLRMSVSMMSPDASANLKVVRNGKEQAITVALGELEPKKENAKAEKNSVQGSLEGVEVEELTAEAASQLRLPEGTKGVVVSEIDPSSKAASSGLRVGDVIQEVNRKPVRNAAEFEKAVRDAGKEPLLLVNRRGNTVFVAV
jgi:serine protease Do